jgi:ferritin-like metal-binding protein YciE
MKTLKILFMNGLAEIYDAETRLAWFMPQMVTAATCNHLQDALAANLQETEDHVIRLEGVFDSLGERLRRKTNETTIALLNESLEIMSGFKGFPVINAALIAMLQKIEHYEIASYGCLRDWAAILGHDEVASVLQEILNEDKVTNQSLTDLARSRSNREALAEDATEFMDAPADPLLSRPRAGALETNGHTWAMG